MRIQARLPKLQPNDYELPEQCPYDSCCGDTFKLHGRKGEAITNTYSSPGAVAGSLSYSAVIHVHVLKSWKSLLGHAPCPARNARLNPGMTQEGLNGGTGIFLCWNEDELVGLEPDGKARDAVNINFVQIILETLQP